MMVSTLPQAKNSTSNVDQQSLDGSIQVEFAVNIKEQSHLNEIEQALKGQGVKLVSSDLDSKTIQVELGNDSNGGEKYNVKSLQEFIEKDLGFVAVVKGLGKLTSAVAELRPSIASASEGRQVMGLVRLSQLFDDRCFVDADISGFNHEGIRGKVSNRFSLAIHEFGDLEDDDLSSIGESIANINEEEFCDDDKARKMSLKRIIPSCNVASMIGRSIAITEHPSQMRQTKRVLSAGVIARASTISSNNKQFCSCSGKTIWDERLDRRQT